jgi:hypothetical protein
MSAMLAILLPYKGEGNLALEINSLNECMIAYSTHQIKQSNQY